MILLFAVAFLLLFVFVLAWSGIIETIVYPDKPRPPKVGMKRQENLRRGAAHKAAVEEWREWRKGVLPAERRTHPERTYEQNFNFVDKMRGRQQVQG